MLPGLIIALYTASMATAREPPSSCDPTEIQECLSKFELQFMECEQDNLSCQCNSIITTGASCYAACPQDAMTKFIQTYNEGRCATFDPFLQRREAENLVLKKSEGESKSKADQKKGAEVGKSAMIDALTIVPNEPTTTISLTPQEYHSQLEKSRYKENLRSIRSERARLSSEAENRFAVPTVNNKEAVSSSRTTTSSRYANSTETETDIIQSSGSMRVQCSVAMLAMGLMCLCL